MGRRPSAPSSSLAASREQELERYNSNWEFNRYLAYILGRGAEHGVQPSVRLVAGATLKANIDHLFRDMSNDLYRALQQDVLVSLSDADRGLRRACANCVSTMVRRGGLASWPELLGLLSEGLERGDRNTQSGAFFTLVALCEDVPSQLERDERRPLNSIIPLLIHMVGHENEEFRVLSLTALQAFIPHQPAALLANMQDYLAALWGRTSDPSLEVRALLCSSLTHLADSSMSALAPNFLPIVDFMLHASQEEDSTIAKEALSFWSVAVEAIVQSRELVEAMETKLPQVVPVLVSQSYLTDDDLVDLPVDDTPDAHVPDRMSSIRPTHRTSRAAGVEGGGGEEDGEAGGEEEEEEEGGNEEVENWTVRRAAGLAVDTLATVYGAKVLPLILPEIETMLRGQAESDAEPWIQQEAGVMLIGSLADGCFEEMADYFHEIFPFLLNCSGDAHPILRAIALWTMGRFAGWVAAQPETDRFLAPYMTTVLHHLGDHVKYAQEHALYALSQIAEEAQAALVPYLPQTVPVLREGLLHYQLNSLLRLYDAIACVAEAVEGELARPEYIDALVPLLVERWNALPQEGTSDSDPQQVHILEAMRGVVSALGRSFADFAPGTFARCLRIIENNLISIHAAEAAGEVAVTREPMASALDVCATIITSLGPDAEALVSESNLLDLLLAALRDTVSLSLLMSAAAMVGDLAVVVPSFLGPAVPQVLPLLLGILEPENDEACGNAAWAVAELFKRGGTELREALAQTIQKALPILERPRAHDRKVTSNVAYMAAVAAGACPEDFVRDHLHVLPDVSVGIALIKDSEEKWNALQGVSNVLALAGAGAAPAAKALVFAVASWKDPPVEVQPALRSIVEGFRSMLGPQWEPTLRELHPTTVERLRKWMGHV